MTAFVLPSPEDLKANLPAVGLDTVVCRSCRVDRPLAEYRIFSPTPKLLHFDFCARCEQEHGTITLYRRYNAYGTPQIIDAVFAAARVPATRRTEAQVRLLVEAKQVKAPESNADIVARELARRELMRRRLMYFVTSFDASYTPGWVHHDIARRLERFMDRVEKRESPRLILTLPPRAGKSRLTSDMFASWLLGHHPEWEVMQASYSAELAEQFSRNVRERVRSEEYQAVFPGTKLRSDSQSVGTWRTTVGGGYAALGVGGSATGRGYTCGLIDDPIKDAEAAASETIRENTWAWYQAVFRTRAAPGAGILIINTRWHDSDLVGKLLAQEDEHRRAGVSEDALEGWEVVNYPAVAEDDEHLLPDGQIWRGALPDGVSSDEARLLRAKGEALHPERFPLRELLKIKAALASPIWSALYQQNPTPDDGDFFKRSDVRYLQVGSSEYFSRMRRFMTVDYALRKKQRNDWTVMAAFALDADDMLYCIGMIRGRWSTYEIAANAVAFIKRHKPEVYAGEQGQIHYAVWPVIQKQLRAERMYISVDETLTPMTEKEVRARPLQARTQTRRFTFAYSTAQPPDEYRDAEREMLRFPNGTFDDTVDALAWGARLALNTTLPQRAAPPPVKSWRNELSAYDNTAGSHMGA